MIEADDDFFDYVLTREHCLFDRQNNLTIKDLRLLLGNRDMKDIILVDNTSKCYVKQMHNGIPIPTYTGSDDDKVLLLLRNYLFNKILHCEDVREVLKVDFKLDELE